MDARNQGLHIWLCNHNSMNIWMLTQGHIHLYWTRKALQHLSVPNPPGACLEGYGFACVRAQSVSCIWISVTAWTVAYQTPLSVELSHQESWSGLPFPPPGDLKPVCPAGGFFTTEPPGTPCQAYLSGGIILIDKLVCDIPLIRWQKHSLSHIPKLLSNYLTVWRYHSHAKGLVTFPLVTLIYLFFQ